MASRPPNTQPKSAARNGSQANSAICFRSKCRTLLRYSGSQKVSVPHVGSARKRGRAMPQKFRCARIFSSDGPRAVALQVLLLPGGDVLALLSSERARMPVRRLVEQQPQHHPDQTQRAGDHERRPPVVGQDRPGHQRRRQHRADRGADVVDAAGQPALLGRETIPPSPSCPPGWPSLRRSPAARAARQTPASCWPAQCAILMSDHAIAKIAKPDLQPDHVQHVAADRLQHDRALERADDPRILLRR